MLPASALPRVTTNLLALLLLADAAGAQTAQEMKSESAVKGDTLQKMVSREFELYGPTAEEVRAAGNELRTSIAHFQDHIGRRPKPMAFVLFRSAADAGRFDLKPFSRRHMQVVPWLLPASPGHGSAAGQPPPAPSASTYPLGHLAGHEFFIGYAEQIFAEAGKAGAGGTDADAGASGIKLPVPRHPECQAVPDWIDEAVATLCEGPLLQRIRMDFMRSHLEQRIPFAEFLEMRRPGAGGPDPGKSAKAGGGAKGGAAKGSDAKSAGGSHAAGADREAIFCAEAFSLACFITHREDPRFFGKIVEGVLMGRTAGEVLNTSQDIHSKPEALEKQWLEWMQGAERAP